ncbi:MAG TPA: molybdopterin-dependent oxidoreductase [Glaciibacter sp.]|nr:molybdopterin-dependent oxidoreductase [Glaciibacter sp.]
MTRRRESLWASSVGVLAAGMTLAIAEVAAFFIAPASGPVFAVGAWVIDIAPAAVKTLVIALFGAGDKAVLLVVLGLVVLVLAVFSGILEYRRPPFGAVVVLLSGAIAVFAVLTRAESTLDWAAPTILGAVGGIAVLRIGIDRLRGWTVSPDTQTPARAPDTQTPARAPNTDAARDAADPGRRRFLGMVIGTAAAVAIAGVGARLLNGGTLATKAVRSALKLPQPAVPAPAIPAGASLPIPGISPLVSSNEGFYRIDTALQVPAIDVSQWRMKITGMVENPIELTFDELMALPLIETYITLMCVSNEVGGSLAGNAKWLGYPIAGLLERARPLAGADVVLSTSQDGWTATTPLEVLRDTGRTSILAVGMNDKPLPLEHGFPVRMVVPGLYGYVSATKWVVELKVSTFREESAYWTDRGWSATGPIKTSSRIDVPRPRAQLKQGTVAIAGVAWAQHTGIERVEVRIDGGEWRAATLAEPISIDTWRQWVYEWDAAPGYHAIEARATDAAGGVQSGMNVPVLPDGAEGWHRIDVVVSA